MEGGRRWRQLGRSDRWVFALGLVVVALPFVAAAFAAHADGWVPVGDNAKILVGARQVFSAHPPLVGQVTSSEIYGITSYHPGPLLFYAYAPFVRLLGAEAGLLAGAAAVQVAALAAIGYATLRVAGLRRALGAWAVALLVALSLDGTSYLYDPYHTVAGLLPLLAALFLTWAVLAGAHRLLGLWVLAASLAVHTAAQYALVVAGLVTLVGGVLLARAVVAFRRSAAGGRGEAALPREPASGGATRLDPAGSGHPEPMVGADGRPAETGTDGQRTDAGSIVQGPPMSGRAGARSRVLVVGHLAGLAGVVVAVLAPVGPARALALGTATALVSAAVILLARPAHRSIVAGLGRIGVATPGGRRAVGLALAAAVLAWVGPLVEAVAHDGGNVVALRDAVDAATDRTLGLGEALAHIARAVVFAPVGATDEPLGAAAAGGAVVAGIAAVLLVGWRWRRLAPVDRWLVPVAAVGLVTAVVSVAGYDAAERFDVFRVLALSAAAGFAWFTVGSVAATALADRSSPVWLRSAWAPLAGVGVLAVAVAVPLPVDEDREYGTWTFAAVEALAPEAADGLQGDGAWTGFPVGPRSMMLVTDGLMADLEDRGVATSIHPPIGWGYRYAVDGIGPSAGWFLVAPDQVAGPPGWEAVARYAPPGRDAAEADAVAREAVAHAAATDATLTDLGELGVADLGCPQARIGEPCRPTLTVPPGGRVADLPPWVVALLYAERPARVVDGPPLPPDLQARLDEHWLALPVTLWSHPTPT